MLLTVTVSRLYDTHIIIPNGSIDSTTYDILEKRIDTVLAESASIIVINMEDVTYVSSMGLNVILKTRKSVEENGGVFVLINLKPRIKKVFDIVKSLPGLNIFNSMKEADEYLDKIQKGEV